MTDSGVTITLPNVPDALIRPDAYQKGEEVEYLDPAQVYEVKAVSSKHAYTIEQTKPPKHSQIGPVPDGLIRPH